MNHTSTNPQKWLYSLDCLLCCISKSMFWYLSWNNLSSSSLTFFSSLMISSSTIANSSRSPRTYNFLCQNNPKYHIISNCFCLRYGLLILYTWGGNSGGMSGREKTGPWSAQRKTLLSASSHFKCACNWTTCDNIINKRKWLIRNHYSNILSYVLMYISLSLLAFCEYDQWILEKQWFKWKMPMNKVVAHLFLKVLSIVRLLLAFLHEIVFKFHCLCE